MIPKFYLRNINLKKLIGYITSSYPNNSFTIDLVLSMKEAGLDKLELGIPFSDPVADGPVIEGVNHKALHNGFRVKDLFEVSSQISKDIDIFWMGYMNIFYQNFNLFVNNAKQFGIKGFIIPDLPYEESLNYNTDIPLIDFIAPTTPENRIKKIVSNSKEFIYLVAYAGITGSNKQENLDKIILSIKEMTNVPVFLGFGVNEHNAKDKAKNVDGVIVGSAFIKILGDDNLNYNQKINKICSITKKIKEAINE
jgi:tryptophan synthase alpha chain